MQALSLYSSVLFSHGVAIVICKEAQPDLVLSQLIHGDGIRETCPSFPLKPSAKYTHLIFCPVSEVELSLPHLANEKKRTSWPRQETH